MKFVVAYDGGPMAETALDRAATLADGVDGTVTAITVLPRGNTRYAREQGWIEGDEPWSRERIVDDLRRSVDGIVPTASFEYREVERYAPRGKIGHALRQATDEEAADVLVIGTENTGRIFTTLTTVTRSVAQGTSDLFVVREAAPEFR